MQCLECSGTDLAEMAYNIPKDVLTCVRNRLTYIYIGVLFKGARNIAQACFYSSPE